MAKKIYTETKYFPSVVKNAAGEEMDGEGTVSVNLYRIKIEWRTYHVFELLLWTNDRHRIADCDADMTERELWDVRDDATAIRQAIAAIDDIAGKYSLTLAEMSLCDRSTMMQPA